MVYEGIRARRARVQGTLDQIDAGEQPLHQNLPQLRVNLIKQRDELDRLIRLAAGVR
jgi:hypothetical protein